MLGSYFFHFQLRVVLLTVVSFLFVHLTLSVRLIDHNSGVRGATEQRPIFVGQRVHRLRLPVEGLDAQVVLQVPDHHGVVHRA